MIRAINHRINPPGEGCRNVMQIAYRYSWVYDFHVQVLTACQHIQVRVPNDAASSTSGKCEQRDYSSAEPIAASIVRASFCHLAILASVLRYLLRRVYDD